MAQNPPAPAKRQLNAVMASVLSLGLHGAALGAIVVQDAGLPRSESDSIMRLGGQTFDVDALGVPSDSEVAPSSPPPAPAPSDAGTQTEAEKEDANKEELTPEASPESPEPLPPEPEQGEPEPKDEVLEESNPEEAKSQDKNEAPPMPAEATKKEVPASKPPVDPFDMGQLPGEATKVEALPSGSDSAESPKGAYGAEGVESTVVDVYAAFLRQIPLAAKSDDTWTHLPVGDAGRIEFVLSVSKEGKLGPVQIISDKRFPRPRPHEASAASRRAISRPRPSLSQLHARRRHPTARYHGGGASTRRRQRQTGSKGGARLWAQGRRPSHGRVLHLLLRPTHRNRNVAPALTGAS